MIREVENGMPQKTGFDNDKYLQEQTAAILARVEMFPKLYLEFGGKPGHPSPFADHH